MDTKQKPTMKQLAYMMTGQMMVLFAFAIAYGSYVIKNPGTEIVAGLITFPIAAITMAIVMIFIRKKTTPQQSGQPKIN